MLVTATAAAAAAQSADQNAMADIDVGWEAGPKERGTPTLLWSWAVTMFACTWDGAVPQCARQRGKGVDNGAAQGQVDGHQHSLPRVHLLQGCPRPPACPTGAA